MLRDALDNMYDARVPTAWKKVNAAILFEVHVHGGRISLAAPIVLSYLTFGQILLFFCAFDGCAV